MGQRLCRVACYANMGFHKRVLEPVGAGFEQSLVSDDMSEIAAWNPDVIVVADGPPIPALREYCDTRSVILIGLQHGSVTRYSRPQQEYGHVHYFCGSEWDVERFTATGVVPKDRCLHTGNPWVDGVFTIPKRELCMDAPAILFAPTYNPEISAARFFESKLVRLVRDVYPQSRIVIKPHPAIIESDNSFVIQYREIFEQWMEDWRQAVDLYPDVELVEDAEVAISEFYSAADILISDGSSLIFEFMALNRPILLYSSSERIATWEYDPDAPGNSWRDVGAPFSTEQEFTAALKDAFKDHASVYSALQANRTLELYGEYQDGRSAQRVIESINALPRLDILVTTRNCSSHVTDAVSSLRNSIANSRIHVVDNASSDGISDAVQGLDIDSITLHEEFQTKGKLLNEFFKSSSASHVLVVDCANEADIQLGDFISRSVQLLVQEDDLIAAGKVRSAGQTSYVDSHYCVFHRERILEIGGFAEDIEDSEVDIEMASRIASAGYRAHESWDDSPAVRFGPGFYGDEDGVRWMSDESVMTVGRPVASLSDPPIRVRFDVACADAENYSQFPFDLRILREGQVIETLLFQLSGQRETVNLELPVKAGQPLELSFVSDGYFVPAELGQGTDNRRLSVWISNVIAADGAVDAVDTQERTAISQNVSSLHSSGRLDEAISSLNDYLADDTAYAQGHNDLGVLNCETGDIEKARHHLEKAVSLDDADNTFRKNLADLYLALGEIQDAEPLYAQILETQPDDVEALLSLAQLWYGSGRLSDAALLYARILTIDESQAEAKDKLETIHRISRDYTGQTVSTTQHFQDAELPDSERMTVLPTAYTPLSKIWAFMKRSSAQSPGDGSWSGVCPICGEQVEFEITVPDNLRESLVCPCCQSISRDRMLAYALKTMMGEAEPVRCWKPSPRLRIFETAGYRGHPRFLPDKCDYFNTQFIPELMQGDYDTRRYADLQDMRYPDEFFDVVLTSDVFEHVRLYQKALNEVHRVLKPGGVMLLQVPFRPDGDTITRVQPDGDDDLFLMEPIYHAEDTLEYRLYGLNFLDELRDTGFEVEYIEAELPEHGISQQMIIVCRKPVPAMEHTKPRVSIVIPVFNKLELTRACLNSIFRNTGGPEYEIIVVDNASTDGTAEYLELMASERLKCVVHTENKGFVDACNAGAEIASGDYVLFLNNDTEVQPGWLSLLVQFADATPDCGAVGSKLVYPDGKLQEAGGIVFSDGSGWNYGRGLDPSDPRFNFVREVDYCSGAALMVRKDLWDTIGGFDRRYVPAYYEDTDICFEIRRHGYKVYCQPKSVVVHFEGQTAGTDLRSGFKKHQNTNRLKFCAKWADELANQYDNQVVNIPKASDRGSQKSILVVDPYLPIFDRASGSLRLFSILKILKQLGFHVTFIARNGSMEERYRPFVEDLGVEVYTWDVRGMWAAGYRVEGVPPIDYQLLFRERNFDYALIEFWYLAEYYMPLIRSISPQTEIIVDSVDVHFMREIREAEIKQSHELMQRAIQYKDRELAVYNKADRVWVVTEQDRKSIAALVKDKPVDVIPNVHAEVDTKKEFDKTSDLLFVGNFAHPPNEDAILFFCKEVFPGIRHELPGIKLHVVGNNPADQVQRLASDDVIVTGYVEDLSPYLESARVSVSPLRYGAGMKGKVGEALSWGLPVVTTSIGAEGMGFEDGRHALIADSPDEFTARVVSLYKDKELWSHLSQNGRAKVMGDWSPDAVKSRLCRIFGVDESAEKLVSIVILAFNQLEYTKQCLQSIERCTDTPHEIIIVDNGSTDGTREYLEEYRRGRQESAVNHACRNIKVVSHDRNLGYAEGNNSGIAVSDGEYVLILNNDVVVTPQWLDRLVRCAQDDPGIGIVGPVTNYVSGRQLVADVAYDQSSLDGLDEFAVGWASDHDRNYQPHSRLVGFCMLVKRDVIDKIGGFDARYGLGNFEDDDFSVRAAIAGFRSVIAMDSFVHHFGSRTFAGQNIDYNALIFRNWEIFKQKWELPTALVYGVPYDFLSLTRRAFDPGLHFTPVGEVASDNARWFTAPRWDDTATWHPIVAEYVRTFTPGDESVLSLYAANGDSESAYRRVAEYLQASGVADEECPDIEITGKLPRDGNIRIILSGGDMDKRLLTRFPNRCTRLEKLQRVA